MRNRMRNALSLLLAACVLFLCAAGAAETMHEEIASDTLDMEISVGYDGAMTYGKSMPMRVRIRNFGDDFEGVLGMNVYISTKEYDRYEKEVFLPAGSERIIELDVTVYARQNTFTAELVKDGETVCAVNAEAEKIINPAAMLIGVLSTRPQNLNYLNIDRENDVLGRYELWQAIPLTPETFPEDETALASFGMLVFDDVDPSGLSQKQQDLLDNWVRSGKVILCGGGTTAARNTAFFSKYTGLKLENVATSDSVLENLERLLSRSVSGRKPEAAVAEYSGAEALAADADGRGLVYRTAVGAGRIYTAAFETGDSRLNSESLMSYFWQQLLVDMDQQVYSSLLYNSSDGYSPATVNANYATRIDARSFLLPGMLIVIGVLVLCCVIWWILKKKDKRQWMWLVLPVIAVLAAGGILLVSTGAETNRPLAVIAENMVQGGGTIRNYNGISAAAPAFGRHSYSMAGESLRVQVYDYVDYDEEEEEKRQEPDTLRTCYIAGGENAVTSESLTPWEQVNLSSENPSQIQGRVTGSVWMEEDGLHGEIVNETDAHFAAGVMITNSGYCSVPALAPGEKAEILLTRKTFKDPTNPKYEDGGYYPERPNMYSVISSAVGYDDNYASAEQLREREMASSMIGGAADVLRRDQGNWSYSAYESAMFLYSAKPENVAEPELKVDGVPVEQKAYMSLLTAEIPFSAVGRTGVVFRSAGMDMPERVETDENLMPTNEKVQSARQMYYHSLIETPTFVFELDGMAGVKVEGMQVLIETYYTNQCRAYALNAEARQWEEIKLNEDIKDPGRYISKDGKIYLQFRGDSQDMYADIPTPLISVEGRLEHAED